MWNPFRWFTNALGLTAPPLSQRAAKMRKPKCEVCRNRKWEQTGGYRIGSGRPTIPVRCRVCGTKATLEDDGRNWRYRQ
jgi:hypothetical protein